MNIPSFVLDAIKKIEHSGFEAYVVGGCVRDTLLGKIPVDWDLTTSAEPCEIKQIFSESKIIDIGSKYGTIIVLLNGHKLEITTFRTESEYGDNRHPKTISFTKSLEEDLKRRDFTINALAYNPSKGLIDLFDGIGDLKKRIIRCVGDAKTRFTEDALRIMRALRFSATLGFTLEPETIAAAFSCRRLLINISNERIVTELNRMMLANDPSHVLRIYKGIISAVIPELAASFEFEQNNPHHCFDVWEHTLSAISQSPIELDVRLALLFHDIAKPMCAKYENSGVVHFYDHAPKGAEVTEKILRRLKYDNKTIQKVCLLVNWHDTYAEPNKASIKQMLRKIGADNFRTLLKVQRADNMAKTDAASKRLEDLCLVEQIFSEILEKGECFSLNTLALSGDDLTGTGKVFGKQTGAALNFLLDAVIEEKCENTRSALLSLFNSKF